MKNVLQCTAIHLVECTAKLENVLQNVLLCTAILKKYMDILGFVKELSGHPVFITHSKRHPNLSRPPANVI